jgi:hypothetical protein
VRQYSIFQSLYLACFSRSLYQDVARNWQGLALGYLLLLVSLAWIPSAVMLQIQGAEFAEHYLPKVIGQIPPLTITKGKLVADVPMPLVIKDPETGERLAVIDTSGALTTLEAAQAKALLTQTELILKQSDTEIRTYKFSNIDDVVIDQARLTGWLELFKTWFALATSVFMVAFLFVYRLCQALIYGALGLLFARALKLTLTYTTLVRLAVIAVTPAVLLDVLAGLAGWTIPGPISLMIALIYLYYGIRASAVASSDTVVAA